MPKCSVDRDGKDIFLSIREGEKGPTAILRLSLPGAGALRSLLASAGDEEDYEGGCGLEGELTVTE